ncbi:vanadium-dependent haloperoxidase [Paractinoplanes globisporus]|uniref:Vanadium-dependent haloperoxidase n=1 Tax=Paractinoplanes globisporus TaxID=113565 RepID=A0ABW6WLL8_9ACTN|nr:vanadium-dependent haloperoxidase [Actinoplanes globisporus]
MGTVRRIAGAAVAVALVPVFAGTAEASSPSETASVISDWNAVASATLLGDTGKAPQEIFIYLAFTHAAMYDAVVGIHPRYEPYRRHARAPRHASATAAAAAAGHKVLETYSPYAQAALDDALAGSLAEVPDGAAKTAGIAYGERVAQDLIDLRAHDGRYAPVQYTRAPAPGVWRPTPPAFAPMAVPWLGGVTPLLIRGVAQFAPPTPPKLTSRRYTRDFAEVKALGSATSTTRTAEQTATALFFSGNVGVQVNTALRDQAAVRGLDIVDAARMFAAVNMTTLDALIVTWQTKLDRAYWRPITAIQLATTDGNPATTADPAWTPLLTTPNYPDYVSGYNAVIAASSRALENVVGPRLNLTLISTAVPGTTRHYDNGAALRADVVNARIWLGIHFRTADTEARTLGLDVADWSSHHYFRPTSHR